MKILLAHNNYDIQGGAEVFYRDVGRVLAAQGHEVAFFSARGTGESEAWGEYFPQCSDYKSGGAVRKITQFPSMIYSRESHKNITRLISEFKPDIVHAFATYVKLTPSILTASKDKGVPVVMSCNDYKHICPNYKLYHTGKTCEQCRNGQYFYALKNKCCHGSFTYSAASMLEAYTHSFMDIYRKNVDVFLFASEFMANKTAEFWGADTFKWKKFCNPFDITEHYIDAPVGRYILYFGRLIEEKGVHRLIEAAALSPDVEVKIVGDGPDVGRLNKQIQVSGINNVSMLGPMWGKELLSVLAGARAVVVPSIWHENFPYVIFQAFAAGKPVLGTDRGGIPELVKNGKRGWIYDADDIGGLAEKLKYISIFDDTKLKSMGNSARSYVKENYNDKKIYKDLCDIYEGVLV